MPTAIVAGATGILGRAIVQELGKRSDWTQIHALSRSKKEQYPEPVKHTHIDLTSSADDIAQQLSDVQADYLFFAAYLAADSEEELVKLNGPMLRNFLLALRKTGGEAQLKRVILVTGAKQYGLQFGRTKLPMEESDPLINGSHRPPNFYYVQQDILKEESAVGQWDWTVTYANDVLGVAKGNFMNLVSSLGLYCAITREMEGPMGKLTFPGSDFFYTALNCYTDCELHAQFCVWAATSSTTSNEAFNVVNDDVESWQNLWPKLAQRFGLTIDAHMLKQSPPDPASSDLADPPPIDDHAHIMGLKDYFGPSKAQQRIPLVKWSQRSDVKDAWHTLATRENLEHDAFEKATWGFLDFVLGRDYNIVISMNKAKKAGWSGWACTWDSFEKNFRSLEDEKVLPKAS